jgi:predicted transcriptional regulator
MILDNKNLEEFKTLYEKCIGQTKVWLKCDYCGIEFQRIKKSRERVNKNINKDSCGAKICKKQKQEEVCLKIYGKKNSFEAEEIKQKTAKTNIEKFGCENYFDSKLFATRRKQARNN